MPPRKLKRGYRYEPDKLVVSGFTAEPSHTVAPPRVRECPIQLEAVVESVRDLAEGDAALRGRTKIFEVRIQRVHVDDALLIDGKRDHIDPDKWRPLIMSFQKFYGLAPGQLLPSRLGQVPEQLYRSPDVDRAPPRSVECAPASLCGAP